MKHTKESGIKKEALDIIKNAENKKNKRQYTGYLDKVNYLADKYRSAVFFIFLQFFVILFLIFGYLSVKSNIVVEVILPKVVKDTDYGKLKIGINSSNPLYYKVWGEYIVTMLLNSNADNIVENISTFQNIIYPDVYNKYKKDLKKMKDYIIKNDADLKYKEVKKNISIKNGEALFSSSGILTSKLGRYKSKKSNCTVNIKMKTENYMLFVTSFVKQCKNLNIEDGKK